MTRLLEAAYSKNTHAAYATGLAAFSSFRIEQGFPNSWPPRLDQVVSFIASLSMRGLAHNTVRLYISSISNQCKLLGVLDITKNFIVTKLLEGIKRTKHKADARLPITAELLSKLMTVLPQTCSNLYEAKLFSAAFSLAFFGFLRVGELSLTKGTSQNDIIAIHDVLISDWAPSKAIKLHLRHSKTDQLNTGITMIIPSVNVSICPVANLQTFLLVRPSFKGPLFCHYGGQPLTRYQFSTVLQKSLRFLGIDSSRFRSHSFRIGAATTAAMAGHSPDVIQCAGRWKSQVYKSYIRCPLTHIPADLIQ